MRSDVHKFFDGGENVGQYTPDVRGELLPGSTLAMECNVGLLSRNEARLQQSQIVLGLSFFVCLIPCLHEELVSGTEVLVAVTVEVLRAQMPKHCL